METIVTLGDLEEPVLALVDHALEINLMAESLHQKVKWPVDVDHGWRIQAANMLLCDLYDACKCQGMQSELQSFNVLDPNNFFSEEISYVDMMQELEEIKQNKLQNWTEFIKVNSMNTYEMLLQLKYNFEDAIDVQVETKYKRIAKKVKPIAMPSPEGSNEVIEEASRQPMLRDPRNIGHKFTEETLKQLKIGKDGSLIKRSSVFR
ncbi:hypothetical protein L7F22_052190 [Adiantum nelumboides]|nr:hypothetical protein [Adiantum nelumboides]